MADNSFLIRLGIDTANLAAGINRSNTLLARFQGQVSGFARTLAAGAGFYGLSTAVMSAVSSMAHFEKSMSEVRAITGASGADFNALRDNAINLAGAFKAIDISRMEVELGRLGFTTKEILDTTESAVQLAIATGSDLGKSADVLGSTLRAFNLSASESARVADVMASGFNKSALSLENFSEAIKYVAPVAANANISLEQTTALLGVLADNGIRGSMAGTSLRKIISDLGNGAGPMLTKRFQEMAAAGITGAQAMDEVGRTAYASLLILANNTDKINSMTGAHKNANGELSKMSRIMQDNLIGDLDKLAAGIDATIQKSSWLGDAVRQLTQGFTTLWNGISQNTAQLAIANLTRDAKAFRDIIFGNDNYTVDEQKMLFKKLEEQAKSAGVKLQDYIDDYKFLLTTLHGGGDYNVPAPPPKTNLDPASLGKTAYQTQLDAFPAEKLPFTNKELMDNWSIEGFRQMAVYLDNLSSHSIPLLNEQMGYATDEYKAMFAGQDALNDEYLVFNEEIAPGVQASTEGIISAYKKTQKESKELTKETEKLSAMAGRMAVQFGPVMSDAIADAITGARSLGDAMSGAVQGLIDNLERLALAYIITAATREGAEKPFFGVFAAISGAILGFGIIKSLFGKARGSGGGGGSGGGPSGGFSGGRDREVGYSLSTRVRGTDLEIILGRTNDQNSFAKPSFG